MSHFGAHQGTDILWIHVQNHRILVGSHLDTHLRFSVIALLLYTILCPQKLCVIVMSIHKQHTSKRFVSGKKVLFSVHARMFYYVGRLQISVAICTASEEVAADGETSSFRDLC